jgi:hypothetical protein
MSHAIGKLCAKFMQASIALLTQNTKKQMAIGISGSLALTTLMSCTNSSIYRSNENVDRPGSPLYEFRGWANWRNNLWDHQFHAVQFREVKKG